VKCHAYKTRLYPEPRTFSANIPIQFFQDKFSYYTPTYLQAFPMSFIFQGFPSKLSVLNPVPGASRAPTLSSYLIFYHHCNWHIKTTKNMIRYLKGTAVPLQAWRGPEVSSKLRFQDFLAIAQDGSKVVSLRYRPHLPQGNTPGTHFC
jgi:hypothetical protein